MLSGYLHVCNQEGWFVMTYEFKSIFSRQIQEMLEYRVSMGYSVKDYNKIFANFDRFCMNHFLNEAILTKEIAFAWCNDAKGNGKGGFNRASALRGFAQYILLTGQEAYIMPPSFFPMPKSKPPIIMNNVELKNFFEATDRYHNSKKNILCEFTVPVIFRLQYACGMRPQEVRCLRFMDFNFTESTIYIADGKRHKDRCLPVNADVMEMCKRYNRIVEKLIPNRTYFFQSQSGDAYTTNSLCSAFRMCWRMSGNETNRGSCTPYALRHNFATQILMRWIEEGRNLDAMIPYLSAYMGHESFTATYYYIHLLPERLALMDFTRSDGIIPEVYNYEED
jgi:integrase/recombinase XerD